MRALPATDDIAVDNELKQALVTDYHTAVISDFNKLILDYVRKLTLTPADVANSDIDRLRQHGADDQLLHDLVQVVAYFNYVNRLADGLGVELEE